jgi:hypothetical protein
MLSFFVGMAASRTSETLMIKNQDNGGCIAVHISSVFMIGQINR